MPLPQIHVYQEPQNTNLFGNSRCKQLRWDHARLGWAHIQWLMSLSEDHVRTLRCPQGKMPCDDESRDWRYMSTSQEMPRLLATTRLGRSKEVSSPRAFRESMVLPTLWFRTSCLKTVRQYISVILSHIVHGRLFWQS